jgi:hypothetical protein
VSLLTIVAAASLRVGISEPSTVISNTDENVVRMLALANEEGEELANVYRWQRLCTESTFTSVATESQGVITTLAASDFNYLANDTVWNRTVMRQMHPVTDVEWQLMKARVVSSMPFYFRIRGNTFRVIPTMTAGQTVAFEWYSKNWCSDVTGATTRSAWSVDTDIGILDEGLMKLGLVWRWKRTQGLDYAEDFNAYQLRVQNAASRDGAKQHLRLTTGGSGRLLSNYNVAEGSWSL